APSSRVASKTARPSTIPPIQPAAALGRSSRKPWPVSGRSWLAQVWPPDLVDTTIGVHDARVPQSSPSTQPSRDDVKLRSTNSADVVDARSQVRPPSDVRITTFGQVLLPHSRPMLPMSQPVVRSVNCSFRGARRTRAPGDQERPPSEVAYTSARHALVGVAASSPQSAATTQP